jgi:hypothetical protein
MILLLDRSDLVFDAAMPAAEISIVLLGTRTHYPAFAGPRRASKRRSCMHATR